MLTAGAWASAQFEPAPQAQGAHLPEVIATVAGEPITRDFLIQAFNAAARRVAASPQAQQQGVTGLNQDQQRQILESIISNRITLHLAREADLEIDEAKVDEFVERERLRFPSPEIFQDFLRSEGITEEVMRERTREMLLIQAYRDKIIGDMTVDEAEVIAHYEEMRDEGRMNAPKTWDFRHILIRIDPNDPDSHNEGEARIRQIHERVAGGEDFGDVAREVSEDLNSRDAGGFYRNVPRGRGVFDERFEERALSVPVGEISEPFATPIGWHIIKMLAEHEAGLMSFDRVSESLELQLLTQRQIAAFQEHMTAASQDVKVELFVNVGGTVGQPAAPGQQPAAPLPQPGAPGIDPGGSAIDDLLRQLDEGS